MTARHPQEVMFDVQSVLKDNKGIKEIVNTHMDDKGRICSVYHFTLSNGEKANVTVCLNMFL